MNGKVTIAVLLALAVFTVSANQFADRASEKMREAGIDATPFKEVIDQFSEMEKTRFIINGDRRDCYKLEYRGRLVLCCDEPHNEEPVFEPFEESEAFTEQEREPIAVSFAPESMFTTNFNDGGRRNLQALDSLQNLQFDTSSLSSICPSNQYFTTFGNCLNQQIQKFANSTSNSTLNSTGFQQSSDDYVKCVQQVSAQLQQSSSNAQTCLDALNGIYQVFSQCGMTSNSTEIVSLTQDEMTCLSQFTTSLNQIITGNDGSRMSFFMAALVALLGLATLL